MLKSGIAIDGALRIISEQSENDNLRKIFREILKNVEDGIGLAESMKKYPRIFSPTIVSIISVGEKGGSLEKNLLFLGDYLKKAHELDSKLKAALLYPIIILSLTVVEMFGIIFFILPQLENLFTSFKNIPDYTRFVLAFSHFIRSNVIIIGVVIFVLIVFIAIFLRTHAGKIFKDHLSLNFPIMKKLYKSNILATFSRTLGILLDNGIPLVRALHITSETIDNTIYSTLVLKIHKRVENGENLATTLDDYKKQFPGTFTRMIGIGEETGTLQENLVFLYEFYVEEVDEMSNNITTLIEPILLIFIGIMIGGLALMIIGPIYQLTSSING
jgi:type IV pilus assembly protein PilC